MQLEPATVRVTGSYRFLPRTMEHVLGHDEIPARYTGSTGMTVHIDHAARLQGMQRSQLACGDLVPVAMLFQEEPGFGYRYCIAQQLRVRGDLINVVHRNGLQRPPDFSQLPPRRGRSRTSTSVRSGEVTCTLRP